ncbi:hypothetical protein ANAPC5_01463 [Anaplasma phagocytophilum]|nr:hypothetical protein ANAPC5_01463 [Anaplasma phagocytophilum]
MIANFFRRTKFVVGTEKLSEGGGASDDFEEPALNETWREFSCFVGAVPEGMTTNDFVGDDGEAGTTAELTDMEIAAEVTHKLAPKEVATKPGPSNAESLVSLPTLGKAVAALVLLCRYAAQ